jgi:hypothetical protein
MVEVKGEEERLFIDKGNNVNESYDINEKFHKRNI